MKDNTWKIGEIKLSAMTYTFECDNKKCFKTIVCLLSKYDGQEYFGRCNYCHSGRLKWIQNVDLFGVLTESKILHSRKRIKSD